jgi:peptide/nickel transport system substrate-binding protein/oligopeptide transport system substrate-binding protein
MTPRILTTLLLGLGLLLTACPGPPQGGPGATSASRSGDGPPADGYFRWRMRENPPDLDPSEATDTTSGAVTMNVNDGLVEFEPVDGKLEVVPAVAERWTVSEDGRVYDFYLRDNVYFHNGRVVTSADVDYSFHRTLSPAQRSERDWVLMNITGAREYRDGKADRVTGIEILGDHHVRLSLTEPFAPFLGLLCMEAASIIPKEVYEDPDKAYLRHPVGCGPFAFEQWQQSNFLKLKAFDKYYKGRAKMNGIKFRFIENLVTAVEEYKNGGLDFLDELPPGQRRLLDEALPGEYHRWPQLGVYYFAYNHQLPPFKDNKKLRQAMNHAIDRRYICEKLQEGKDIPAYGILPPGLPGHREESTVDPYDPEKAKRLLAEAGYPNGEGLPEIVFNFNTNEGHQRVAQQIQQDLAAIGVKISLRNTDWGTYLELVEGTDEENSNTAFYRMGWIADYPDADNFMTIRLSRDYWGPKGNYSRFYHPEFERLIAEARAESDPAARVELYKQAEAVAVEEAAWMFIYFYGEEALIKPHVKGYRKTPQGDFATPMWHVHFDDAGAAGASAM